MIEAPRTDAVIRVRLTYRQPPAGCGADYAHDMQPFRGLGEDHGSQPEAQNDGGTTNTGLLAYALARAGYPVTCYDADESLQSAARWAREAGDFPCEVHVADTPAFAEVVYPAMDHDRINLVNAGHAENRPDIVNSILEVVDLAILTLSPTQPN
jgi:hypothetical protein